VTGVQTCALPIYEAVKTNVLGSENVMSAAIASRVSRVVMLSTDNAVYPINAMGISKAMMEKFMVSKARMQNIGDTVFCATRYGNVMASRGSVIPLFVDQLKSAKPITITDPEMTRFLMSLEDSVDLVLYAFEQGRQGDIFVQKAPASTVSDMAQALKELFKKENPVNIIGTRHGEKLYETLISREEMFKAEDLGDYYRIPADNRDLNYSQFFTEGEEKISIQNDYTSHNTKRLNVQEIKELLLKIDFIVKELNA
jgi:UDP-glucose 4-epimerase